MGNNNIKKDRIYKIRKTDNAVEGELLYHGDLNTSSIFIDNNLLRFG